MRIIIILMNLAERLISVLAPHKCLVCGLDGDLLCHSCQLTSLAAPPSRCYRCHAVSLQSQVCSKCRQASSLSHVWVASDYQDIAKELIKRFKFGRAGAAAKPVAAAIEQVLPDLPPDTTLVHIPTANSRVRVRGYDQAKLIAENIAKKQGWQHHNLLMRQGRSRQVGASRPNRFTQIESALIPVRRQQIRDAHILLIDDITTTGATLEAAAKILKKAGARTVDAAVFAQPVN